MNVLGRRLPLFALLGTLGVCGPAAAQSRSMPAATNAPATCEFEAPLAYRVRFAGLCNGRTYAKVTVAIPDEQTLSAELHQLPSEAGSWNDSKKLIVISQLTRWANTTVDDLRMNATFNVYNPDGKIVVKCTRTLTTKSVKCS